jgi:nicotinic acid phosphoribosyltransferase
MPLDKSKASKAGRMKLVKMEKFAEPYGDSDEWEYKTITESHPLYHDFKDELVEVFRNGELLVDQTFSEIRERAKV